MKQVLHAGDGNVAFRSYMQKSGLLSIPRKYSIHQIRTFFQLLDYRVPVILGQCSIDGLGFREKVLICHARRAECSVPSTCRETFFALHWPSLHQLATVQ